MGPIRESRGPEARFTSSELSRTLRVDRVLQGVEQLREQTLALERDLVELLQKTSPMCRESAYNLAHYLGVRQIDIRSLQRELTQLGLSSLGVIEAHVMAALNAVLRTLYSLSNRDAPPARHGCSGCTGFGGPHSGRPSREPR